MRTPVVGGNWKMNLGTPNSALKMLHELELLVKKIKGVEIIIAPPYTSLVSVVEKLKNSKIKVAAQNMYFEDSGAFTGEISPIFLKDIGISHVILGHSERRNIFNETDKLINKKIKKALEVNLIPIVCIGEHLNEREEGRTKKVISDQIVNTFNGIPREDIVKIIIAYEPIWAIGTGKTATPDQAEEIHSFIRESLSRSYDDKTAKEIRIQYGGSIKPENAYSLFLKKNIDGGLVGGASLRAKSFYDILNAAERTT